MCGRLAAVQEEVLLRLFPLCIALDGESRRHFWEMRATAASGQGREMMRSLKLVQGFLSLTPPPLTLVSAFAHAAATTDAALPDEPRRASVKVIDECVVEGQLRGRFVVCWRFVRGWGRPRDRIRIQFGGGSSSLVVLGRRRLLLQVQRLVRVVSQSQRPHLEDEPWARSSEGNRFLENLTPSPDHPPRPTRRLLITCLLRFLCTLAHHRPFFTSALAACVATFPSKAHMLAACPLG